MAIAGIPWWTTDVGGFFGGKAGDPAFKELLVRWFEYGAFCPVLRIHGDRLPEKPPLAPGGLEFHSGADNEVWSYGEETLGILTKYLLLRERMRPYIASIMREAHERGTPPMRPLFYDFPKDEGAWGIEDQFLFGPDILVAPVLSAGAAGRRLYLPAGASWIDAWGCAASGASGGAVVEGGRWIDCEAPLDRIPLFLRSGARVDKAIFR
jgi:alpha-D-xyloside xylohydrolase